MPSYGDTGNGTATEGIEITGFVLALIAIAISTINAGDAHESFELSVKDPASGSFAGAGGGGGSGDSGEHPFAASYFHLVFLTGSMYSAMLFVGWQRQGAVEDNSIDHGWGSTHVKMTCNFLSGLLYLWTLAAPFLFPNREFS